MPQLQCNRQKSPKKARERTYGTAHVLGERLAAGFGVVLPLHDERNPAPVYWREFGISSGTIHGLPPTRHGSTESLLTYIRTQWIRFRCGMHPSNGSTCATGTEALALDLYPMIVVPSDRICPK
jgi:hypothetical protein